MNIYILIFISIILYNLLQAEERKGKIVNQSAEFIKGNFWIYKDKGFPLNHYMPSGWMGDVSDMIINIGYSFDPSSGTTCTQIKYSAKGSQDAGWAGIYWRTWGNEPPRNIEGFNLSHKARKLKFWARGENGGEIIKEFRIGYSSDSFEESIGPITLTKKWKEYEIDLEGKDLSYISGGFAFIVEKASNPNGIVFYLDEIRFMHYNIIGRTATFIDNYFWIYKDKKSPLNHYYPSGWMGDYGDIKINDQYSIGLTSGTTCIRIIYAAKGSQDVGWAGIYWVDIGSHGSKYYGYDLDNVKRLKFWVRGERGGEVIKEFKVGGTQAYEITDSDTTNIGPIELTKEWKEYEISLMSKDLSLIYGGFAWIAEKASNPTGIIFYLDEIRFEK